jgi:flagellar motor switch/type III secretory pathway protein FliN
MAEAELAKLERTEPVSEVKSLSVAHARLPMSRIEEHASWPMLSQLRLAMTASVVLRGFKVRDLLRLEPGQVVESAWPETEDVPLIIGQVQVAWSEFEVVDQHLVVRLTRLA